MSLAAADAFRHVSVASRVVAAHTYGFVNLSSDSGLGVLPPGTEGAACDQSLDSLSPPRSTSQWPVDRPGHCPSPPVP